MQPAGPHVARRSVVVGLTAVAAGCLGRDDGAGDGQDSVDDGSNDSDDDSDGSSGDSDDGTADSSDDGTDDANGDVDPPLREEPQMGTLDLTSPAFDDGERIPEEYGYDHENVNPPLRIEGVPDDAETLALVMDDPDAVEPAGKVWDHWVAWNVPPDATEIPEDWQPETAEQGTNDFGEVGYGGPAPPDREHRYRFGLFALDTSLDRPRSTDADALRDAVEGHVLAQTQLAGTYPTD